ncbi:protein of unknown function [Amycolatopsis xylanica]|uniref:DUF4380 domain-containing protein n=1 Tax=Amycolatopsis xylanica TaxID=589385 RepID=A0A1H3JSC2_9PSEU|nr:DUF4380 domain-containing protein [Amycolatopsis xylanica]SDY42791.1 protein of unknown function [Amycolatopsis xylanica]
MVEVRWLDNGILRLGFVPALGGRLLSLIFDGKEVLWRNASLLDDSLQPIGHTPKPVSGTMGDWVNYGGDKTWPAPQDEWCGPPDPILDSGPYTVSGELVLTSAPDPRTGLRLSRQFTLLPDASSFHLRLTAVNISPRPVRWALWNVTQLPPGVVHVGLDGEVVELIGSVEHRDGVIPVQSTVGKLGFPGSTGWVTHFGHEVSLTQRFAVDLGAEYPDSGSPLEVWLESPQPEPISWLGGLNPPDHIVECEVLGPITTLAPGERTMLDIDYELANRHSA